MADQIHGLDATAMARLKDFALMVGIARGNPLYASRMTDAYLLKVIGEAAKAGKYVLMLDPRKRGAFFTYLRPRRPVGRTSTPRPEDWREAGKVLWIGDVCCARGVSALWLGKAIRHRVRDLGLAQPGEKCVYWRNTGRFGWFTVE